MITAILRASCGCEREIQIDEAKIFIDARMGSQASVKQFAADSQVGPTVWLYREKEPRQSTPSDPK